MTTRQHGSSPNSPTISIEPSDTSKTLTNVVYSKANSSREELSQRSVSSVNTLIPPKRQAMNDIESSVTKLLIATKRLLECLTQWGRLEASEKDVSDIYVSLGNEFNRATIAFGSVGIDMSDLESTPSDLRNILERALGEEATSANLERFLPRVREIIIGLLQGLKKKQQMYRMQNGEPPQRPRRSDGTADYQSVAQRQSGIRQSRTLPSSVSAASSRSLSPAGSAEGISDRYRRDLPQLPPTHRFSVNSGSVGKDRVEITKNPSGKVLPSVSPYPVVRDAMSRLNSADLERRASRRLSEFHMTQLTSVPHATRSNISLEEVRRNLHKQVTIQELVEDEDSEGPTANSAVSSEPNKSPHTSDPGHKSNLLALTRHDPGEQTPPSLLMSEATSIDIPSSNSLSPRQNSHHTVAEPPDEPLTKILFFSYLSHTRKVNTKCPVDMATLISTFHDLYGLDDLDCIYLRESKSGIEYQLEETSDIIDRSILIAHHDRQNIQPTVPSSELQKQSTCVGEEVATKILEELASLRKTFVDLNLPKVDSVQSSVVNKSNLSSFVGDSAMSTIPFDSIAGAFPVRKIIADLRQDLATSKTLQAQLFLSIAEFMKQMEEKARSIKIMAGKVSVNREQITAFNARHEQRATELTARVEELMNAIDKIKMDVLQRKISPRPQQLIALAREFEEYDQEAEALDKSFVSLDQISNKLWEEELLAITHDSETLEYQRAFIADLKSDLSNYKSVLDTVRMVEEQKKITASSPSSSTVSLFMKVADPVQALKFVQQDIKSLQVNHEARAEAIERAEKEREKDKEYLMQNEFANELGKFVEASSLKKIGGAEEIERSRAKKDEKLRQMIYTDPAVLKSPEMSTPKPEIDTSLRDVGEVGSVDKEIECPTIYQELGAVVRDVDTVHDRGGDK